jgi:hypothetical protein
VKVQQAFRSAPAPVRAQAAPLLGKGLLIPSAMELRPMCSRNKLTVAPWRIEVSKCAPQKVFRDLKQAFTNVFDSRSGTRASIER